MKYHKIFRGSLLVLILVILLGAILWPGGHITRAAERTVCPGGPPACGYDSIQAAVDDAGFNDEIKVAAGTYNLMNMRGGKKQVLYLYKTVVVRGGYAVGNWTTPDPDVNHTIIDAQDQGRGIYIAGAVGPTVEGLRIINGNAAGLGGGVDDYDAGGAIYVARTARLTLRDNFISQSNAYLGAGLYLASENAEVHQNVFQENRAIYGGAMYLREGAFEINDNTISNNIANYGAGIRLHVGYANFRGNTLTGNASQKLGGGLYMSQSNGALGTNEFRANTAEKGGGLYLFQGQTTLNNNDFNSNNADIGGGVFFSRTISTFSANEISSNEAITGGGLYIGMSRAVTLTNNTVSSNEAQKGGGMFLLNSPVTVKGKNKVRFNTAEDGGGIYLLYSAALFDDNEVNGNESTRVGGGLYVALSDAEVSNSKFFSNVADYGGGIYLRYGEPTLTSNEIYSNTARTSGGGLRLYETDARVQGSTIRGNISEEEGGGVSMVYGNPTFVSNVIDNNIALFRGGGIYLSAGAGEFRENQIINNVAREQGGGVCVDSNHGVTLKDNMISSNLSRQKGGGVYLHESAILLQDNQILDNNATQDGGGLFSRREEDSSSPEYSTVAHNMFKGNAARLGGGGIYLENSIDLVDSNEILLNNAADGGGVYIFGDSPRFVNNIVADNKATTSGSGVYVGAASPGFLHTTIAHNVEGDGVGLYITHDGWEGKFSNMALTNTILINHTIGVTITAGSRVVFSSTLWGVEESVGLPYQGGDGTIITEGDFYGSPLFTDTYRIITGSVAIDVGVSAGVFSDIDNDARPYGAGPDLGADEYAPAGALKYVYLPLVQRQ